MYVQQACFLLKRTSNKENELVEARLIKTHQLPGPESEPSSRIAVAAAMEPAAPTHCHAQLIKKV